MTHRILPLEKGHNFRELGGYQTTDGRTLKWHKLLRSASLAHLNQHDLNYLSDYGVRYDIDFRSPDERTKAPDKVPAKTTYEALPVFKIDETASTVTEAELFSQFSADAKLGHQQMVQVYADMINQSQSKQAYQRFFELLLANNQSNQALLFHCTAGKDRTGMGTVFLLSALNVPESTIRTDYLLTNEASAKHVEKSLAELQQKTQDQSVFQSYRSLLTVHPDYLAMAKQSIEAQAGSIQNYLTTDLGLTHHDLADLRKIYLD